MIRINKLLFGKHFNSLKTKISMKSFTTINLVSHSGITDRSINDNFNKKVNWELAKVWVNPQNNSYWNSIQPTKPQNRTDEQCIIAASEKVGSLQFDRFTRKIGIVMSREENVYIQDGIYKDKKVRIVSSNKEDASNASSIFEGKQHFDDPDVYVLYITNNEEIGTHKRFVFYDIKKKILLSNTQNLSNLTSVIEGMQSNPEKKV
jgi:hypothetical protein